jgi:hypothetical protein
VRWLMANAPHITPQVGHHTSVRQRSAFSIMNRFCAALSMGAPLTSRAAAQVNTFSDSGPELLYRSGQVRVAI